MSRLVKKRERLLRVRHVQHVLAVAETSKARDEARQIETNRDRLSQMRSELFSGDTTPNGAVLASQRELAARLDHAGRQLDGALYDAKRRIEQRQALAIAADREREIAERLKDKARRAAEERLEARLAAVPLRSVFMKGKGEA